MVFDVSATLKTGTLVHSSKAWPLSLSFHGNANFQLFCMQLKEDTEQSSEEFFKDVTNSVYSDTLKNVSFENIGLIFMNCPLTEVSTNILSLLSSSHLAASMNGLIHEKDFGKSSSFFIWFEAELKNLHFLNDLIRIGYDGNTTFLCLTWLSKNQKADDSKQTPDTKYFYACLPDLQLFHTLDFTNLHLKVLLQSGNNVYSISGQIVLTLYNAVFTFGGDLRFCESGYSAVLECSQQTKDLKLPDPIGNYLQFQQLRLCIHHMYETESADAETEYYLDASVRIAHLVTGGSLHFQHQKIQSAGISLNTGFSLSHIWNCFFPSCVWDEEVFDLTFQPGSFLKYENVIGKDGADVPTYQIELKTSITLIEKFDLTGKLDITEDKIQASLNFMKPIDFGFLVLCTQDSLSDPLVKGPECSFTFSKSGKPNRKEMKLSACIIFLEQKILNGVIDYIAEKNQWSFNLIIPISGDLKAIFGDTLGISYSSVKGFSLTAPGAEDSQSNMFNFAERLEWYLQMKKGSCKKLDFQKQKNKLKVRYKTQIAIASDEDPSGKICRLEIGGKILVQKETETTVLQHDISPGIIIELKKGVTAQDIFSQFQKNIYAILDSMVQLMFDAANVDVLKEVLKVLVEDELRDYAQGLLCRKLIKKETFEKLSPKEPGGQSSSGGNAEYCEGMMAGGGAAFGAGELFADFGSVFAGFVLIMLFPGGSSGGGSSQKDPLPYPTFYGNIQNGQLLLQIEDLTFAEKYEINLFWKASGKRYDKKYEYRKGGSMPNISLLEIPVLGELYLSVRAIHKNLELSSDWCPAHYLTEATASDLIQWAWNADLCLRDCFVMLKQHTVDLSDQVLKQITCIYGQPDTKETIAKRHYIAKDDILLCYQHLEQAYPNLSTTELIECLWNAGYHKEQICQMLVTCRPNIQEAERNAIFMSLFYKEKGNQMTLKEKVSFLTTMWKSRGISDNEWIAAMAEIYAGYDPIEFAKVLKEEMNFSARDIAKALKGIAVQYKAIIVGGILLNTSIYPNTSREDMLSILKEVFPDENLLKAIQILYPTIIEVSAATPWNDTGIFIETDESVQVEYLSGNWMINPQWGICGPEGNPKFIAKRFYLLPGAPEGCLVGKVGENSDTIIKIGRAAMIPQSEGYLYLGANDDEEALYGAGYRDNHGAIQVVVKKSLR